MDKFCGSPFWDANITWDTDYPKFTPCFEKTVLIWLPCGFLWLLTPIEIYYIFSSKNRNIKWNAYNFTKLIINVFLLIISCADLIFTLKQYPQNQAQVEFFAPTIKILTFVLTIFLLCHNKIYGRRTSGLQFLFWFLLMICGMSQFKSNIIEAKNDENENVVLYFDLIYFPLVVIMFVLNCFADRAPQRQFNRQQKKPCPEYEKSFLSQILYFWFDPLIRLGYKRPLTNSDLWSLNSEDTSAEVTALFDHYWKKSLDKIEKESSTFEYTRLDSSPNKKKQASIFPVLVKCIGGSFLFGSILKLIIDAMTFLSPFFLSKLISYIYNGEHVWKGYLYASLLFLTAVLQSFFLTQYNQKMSLIGMRVCTALISAIYKKALKLSSNARKDSTVGEIVNLMSVDVQRFMRIFEVISIIWSAPLQMGVAMYFLWSILGPSIFSGLAILLIVLPLNAILVRSWEKIEAKQMKNKDQRLKLMNEILNGIKVLKLYAWEPSFETKICDTRNKELQSLKKLIYLNSVFSFIWLCIPFMISLITFGTFVLSSPNNILDSKTAFVALSLFNILQFPLTVLPSMVAQLIQTIVSLKRINKFMSLEELDPSNITNEACDGYPIKIENGTFCWGSDETTLKNITMSISSGSLVAIVGNVGSGKSSLLSALLGEMKKLCGQVFVNGSIAYVPQQAWIQNATLQDNILFGKSMNETLYNSIIDACALKPDFDMLPAGDQTEIGERGINLSGGQKQRVSLARAVYIDSDLYFLDDPLSAVDSHVGKHIFEKVFGSNGLLKHKTRILVTHAVTYLPKVDHIIVLKDGEISEFGTYAELLEKKGAFADFLLQHLSSASDEDNSDLAEIQQQLESNLGSDNLRTKLQRIRSQSESPSENPSVKGDTSKPTVENTDVLENDRLIEEEGIETGNIKWSVYLYYFKSVGGFLTIATIICNILYQVSNIGGNVWLSKWSTSNDMNTTNINDTHARNVYLAVYGSFGIGQAITAFFYNLAPLLGFLLAAKTMHEQLLKGIMRSPLSFFDTTPAGRILSRFSKDVDILDETLPWLISECIFCTFQLFGTLAVISMSTPIFITVIIPIGIMYYLIQRYYIVTSRQIQRLESVTRSPVYSHFQETLTGVSTIRAYKLQERFISESEEKVDYNHTSTYANIIATNWLGVRLEMIGNLVIFFSALFAVISRTNLDAGTVGLSVSYALQITQVFNWLVRMATNVETNIVAVERIKEYSENTQEKPWEMPNVNPNFEWLTNGYLNFDELVIRYRSNTEPVLHGITCHINAGEKVGIVGRTGAGKSTLALALFRIVEAESGNIVIDDTNISNLGLHSLRSRLTIIPQDPVLFTGSLRFNLDPFNVYSDEEIWRSLEHAHLKSFVETLSSKLEHTMEEGGGNFSVGQRQLLCLARALLRKSVLLIMDEATAAIDLGTDDLIQQTIKTEFSSCTILTIAHRINTIMDSDKIMVLDKGKLIEFDTPSNLLQNNNSTFYALAKDAGAI